MVRINKLLLILISGCFWVNSLSAQSSEIKVVSPNGGESLIPDSRYSISWVAKNTEKINIFYSINGGSSWIIIINSTSGELGSYSWLVPKTSTNNLLIKIESTKNQDIFDTSDDFLSIMSSLNKRISNNLNLIKILPLGNSITFDNRSNDLRPVEDKIGYRYPLYNLLKTSGYNFEFIGSEHSGSNFFSPFIEYDRNAGFPGITDDQLNDLLATGIRNQPQHGIIDDTITTGPYLDTYSPDIILLHIGTNGNNLAGGTDAADIENMLDAIDAHEGSTGNEIVVFLARIINRVPNQSYVTTLNDNVVSMVNDRVNNPANDAYPDKVIIVDMENIPNFQYVISPDPNGTPGDMNDQLHPNDKGFSKIADIWFNSLTNYLGELPQIIENPATQYVIEGDNIEFRVSTISTLPLTFQWMKDGIQMVGETDSILTLQNVDLSLDNSVLTCLVENSLGSIETEEAGLFVTSNEVKVTKGVQTLYEFNEQIGNKIYDLSASAADDSLNLVIQSDDSIYWTPQGIGVDHNASIIQLNDNKKLYDNFINSEAISIELWVKPKLTDQNGPARIVTFSKDKFERNFAILQNGNKYEVRLRTTSTDNNGLPSITSLNYSIEKKLTHLVCTFSKADTAMLYINGVLDTKIYLEGAFTNWDSTYKLSIANELIDAKPWFGELNYLAIFNRELNSTEVLHNYNIGADGINTKLNPPSNVTISYFENNFELNWIDNSNIEEGFIIRKKEGINSKFSDLIELNENTNNYTDSILLDGIKHTYIVSAFNFAGESDISNLATFTSPIPSPQNLNCSLDNNDYVNITWVDLSNNELGFIIESKPAITDSVFTVLDTVESNIEFYLDQTPKFFSPHIYRVYAYTTDTLSEYSNDFSILVVDVKNNELNIPDNYFLNQNFPNPFNPQTNINYGIPERSLVTLEIYNVLGQPVKKVLSQEQGPGIYNQKLNANDLSSGVYFYNLKAKSLESGGIISLTKKLLLIK